MRPRTIMHRTSDSSKVHLIINLSILVEKVFYKPTQKRSLKRCVFRFFLKEERVADGCRKRVPHFSCLKVERSVSSRFKVSFGDCEQFFTAGPKNSRALVGVKQF